MDKFQENGLRRMLRELRPAKYEEEFTDPEFVWDMTVNAVMHILDWENIAKHPIDKIEQETMLELVERAKARVIKRDGEDMLAQLLAMAYIYKEQCEESTPSLIVADKETRSYVTTENRDGYDLPIRRYYDVYHLKKRWREFKPGQIIRYYDGCNAVGGYVSGHWSVATD